MDFKDPEDWKALAFVVVFVGSIFILISITD